MSNPINDITKYDWYDQSGTLAVSGWVNCCVAGTKIIYSPYGTNGGIGIHGTALCYDTTQAFDNAAAWSTFDLTSISGGVEYTGISYDGSRYVYFTPHGEAVGGRHGKVARYDTTGSFTVAGSWTIKDITSVDAGLKGFIGNAALTATHLYLAPYYLGGGVYSGKWCRYTLASDFSLDGSWEFFDLTTINADWRGFSQAIYDGSRYIYLIPYEQGTWFSRLIRYDTTGALNASGSYAQYLLSNHISGTGTGFQGAVKSGNYMYLSGHANTGGWDGHIIRASFKDDFKYPNNYKIKNLAAFDADLACFTFGATDGRFIYFFPEGSSPAVTEKGHLVRLDTWLGFDNDEAWSYQDVPSWPGKTNYTGMNGGCVYNEYLYPAPCLIPGGRHFYRVNCADPVPAKPDTCVHYSDSTYRKYIELKATKIQDSFSQEPFFFRLNDASFTNAYRTDGKDIVITDTNGNLIPREIVWFDRTIPDGCIAVRVPNGDYVNGSARCFIQYGGSSVNVANDTAVWNTNYKQVIHGADTTSPIFDSTSNANVMTEVNTPLYNQTGPLGKALGTDHETDGWILTDQTSLSQLNPLTVNIWIKSISGMQTWVMIAGKRTTGGVPSEWLVYYQTITNNLRVNWFDGSGIHSAECTVTIDLDDGNWHKITATIRADLYYQTYSGIAVVDGVLRPTDNSNNNTAIMQDTAATSILASANETYLTTWLGFLAELQLIKDVWSVDQAWTHYTNENGFSTNDSWTLGDVIEVVATPTIDPNGGTFTSSTSVTLTCSTSGSEIRYTLDGSDPTGSSALYSTPITVNQSLTLKAKGFKAGWTDSATANAAFIIVVADPTISPDGGSFVSSTSMAVSCTTSGANIRYTIDGSEPDSESTLYSGPITIDQSLTLKVKGFKASCTNSATVSAIFIISVANPTINPNGGSFVSSSTPITLSCSTSGSQIRYTIDGSDPIGTSTLYLSPITLSTSCTLKIKGFKSGLTNSSTISAIFTITVATPSISPNGGLFRDPQTIILTTTTSEALIRYTLDGSDPSGSSTLYSSPFLLNSSAQVKARGFKTDCSNSSVVSANFIINDVPLIISQKYPRAVYQNGSLDISLVDLNVIDIDQVYPIGFTLNMYDGDGYIYERIDPSSFRITSLSLVDYALQIKISVNDGTNESPIFSYVVEVLSNKTENGVVNQTTLNVAKLAKGDSVYSILYNRIINP